MRRLINTIVFVTLALVSTPSFSYNSDPKTFINELVNDAITTLSNKNISKKDKKKKDRNYCRSKCGYQSSWQVYTWRN